MSQRNRKRRPARKQPYRTPKIRILVVSEGTVTEREYIDGLAAAYRNSTRVDVETVGLGADPKTVVEQAKMLRAKNQQEADRAGDQNLLYEQVWCAFDRDDHTTWDVAIQMAKDNQLLLAASNPSVELWLLLHFVPNPGMQGRKEIRRRLKSYDFSYDKHVNFAIYEKTHKEAVQRGLRMDAISIEDSELHRNPTTGFHALVSAIMEAS